LIVYEYPFNESVRTWLRLERLFARLAALVARESSLDHHHALATLFEILEVGARSDLKGELMKDLDKHRAQFEGYRGNPSVAESALEAVLQRVQEAWNGLNTMQGRMGVALQAHEWLSSVRSRLAVPGGTCEFDLPSYHAWLHRDGASRQADLRQWSGTLEPVRTAVAVLLGFIRETGQPQRAAAAAGVFQQNLPAGRSYQLLRLGIDPTAGLVPEITGHRLMVSVRFLRQDAEGRYRPAAEDCTFEMALCN
jgi:cell division protein ZapD